MAWASDLLPGFWGTHMVQIRAPWDLGSASKSLQLYTGVKAPEGQGALGKDTWGDTGYWVTGLGPEPCSTPAPLSTSPLLDFWFWIFGVRGVWG